MGKWGTGKQSKICKLCKKEFMARRDRPGHFCSNPCQLIGRKKKPKTIMFYECQECTKSFSVRKGQGGTYRFCSIPCMANWRGRAMRGNKHPKWKGGTSKRAYQIRKVVKQAVVIKKICEKCGSTESLQGHHKIPLSVDRSLAEEITNIEVLCSSCHAVEHPHLKAMIKRPIKRLGLFKKCLVCYVEFYIPRHKEHTAKYCSRVCQLKALHG